MGLAAIQLGKALGARYCSLSWIVLRAAQSDCRGFLGRKAGRVQASGRRCAECAAWAEVCADAVVNYGADLKSVKAQVDEVTDGEFCDVIYEVRPASLDWSTP